MRAELSSLLKSWLHSLEPKRHLSLLITQSSLSAAGVLEMILAKLGETPRFKRSANLLALEAHLAQLDPLTLVLVLDDAQNYPAPALEEIRLLLGLGGARRTTTSSRHPPGSRPRRLAPGPLGCRQSPGPMIHPARVSWKVVHKVPMRD